MRIERELVRHPDSSLRFLRFEAAGFGGRRHRHGHYELTWIERGAGIRYVGDDARPFIDGDLVLLGPELPHCWISTRGRRARVAASVLQFPPELFASAIPELRALAHPLLRASRGVAVSGRGAAAICTELAAMRRASAPARFAGLVRILAELGGRNVHLEPLATGAAGSPARPAARRTDRLLDWLRTGYSRPLSVAEGARIAHVTPAAFSRFFRREVGRSFARYLNDVRCSEARVRLLTTGQPIAEIARDCGFPTLSNFNRQFRLRTGTTPREYRRAAAP